MSDKEFTAKLEEGLELSYKRMLIDKAIHNEEVIMGKDNTIYSEKAMDLLKRLYPLIAETLLTQGFSQNLYKM